MTPRASAPACSASARDLGAEQTGTTRLRAAAWQSICPYHYEYGEEEWVLVLTGRPSVRTPEGTEQLEPFDVAFFPKGPAGAHQILNDTDEPVRVLMWSTVVTPTATAYPDSDKVAVWTGDKAEDLIVRRSSGGGLLRRRGRLVHWGTCCAQSKDARFTSST